MVEKYLRSYVAIDLRFDDNEQMNIQTLLLDLRKAGLKQQQIAALTGLSQSYLCDLEKGRSGKRIGFDAYKRVNDLHLRFFTLASKEGIAREISATSNSGVCYPPQKKKPRTARTVGA
jgi:hypothetical protein